MLKGLIGKKIGMTQIFDNDGVAIPVTVIEAGPCYVTQVRTPELDGYTAVQLGFDEVKPKRLTGGQIGHLKRTNLPPLRFLREFRVKTVEVTEGDAVTVENFSVGEKVDIVGTSKGKGFQGVVKRHGFHGAPKTHGHKDQERMPGSIGAGGVQRVFKGRRMAGHMGDERVTVKNLEIVQVDSANNLLFIKGAVPGAANGLLLINGAGDLAIVSEIKEAEPVIENKEENIEEVVIEAEEKRESASAEATADKEKAEDATA